jgi:hypothetical protein
MNDYVKQVLKQQAYKLKLDIQAAKDNKERAMGEAERWDMALYKHELNLKQVEEELNKGVESDD